MMRCATVLYSGVKTEWKSASQKGGGVESCGADGVVDDGGADMVG